MVSKCGFWDGSEWIWNFQWRRPFFEWEKLLFFDLQVLLSTAVLNQQVDDKLVWKHDSNGVYSVKSFVKMAES